MKNLATYSVLCALIACNSSARHAPESAQAYAEPTPTIVHLPTAAASSRAKDPRDILIQITKDIARDGTRTFGELLEGPDNVLNSEVYSRLCERVENSTNPKPFTHPEQVAIAIGGLNLELSHAGLSLYFLNTPSNQAGQAVEALEELKFSKAAELLRKSFAPFPNGHPSPHRPTRIAQVEALPAHVRNAWEPIADELIGALDEAHITERLAAYIRSHKEEFDAPPRRPR